MLVHCLDDIMLVGPGEQEVSIIQTPCYHSRAGDGKPIPQNWAPATLVTL